MTLEELQTTIRTLRPVSRLCSHSVPLGSVFNYEGELLDIDDDDVALQIYLQLLHSDLQFGAPVLPGSNERTPSRYLLALIGETMNSYSFVEHIFSDYGKIDSICLKKKYSQHGYALIKFENTNDAISAFRDFSSPTSTTQRKTIKCYYFDPNHRDNTAIISRSPLSNSTTTHASRRSIDAVQNTTPPSSEAHPENDNNTTAHRLQTVSANTESTVPVSQTTVQPTVLSNLRPPTPTPTPTSTSDEPAQPHPIPRITHRLPNSNRPTQSEVAPRLPTGTLQWLIARFQNGGSASLPGSVTPAPTEEAHRMPNSDTSTDDPLPSTCKICLTYQVEIAFRCGHVVCSHCEERLQECAMCRGTTIDQRRIYLQ